MLALGAHAKPEEPTDAEEDESRRDGQEEVEVGEEAEGIQRHDEEGGNGERNQSRPPVRAPQRDAYEA